MSRGLTPQIPLCAADAVVTLLSESPAMRNVTHLAVDGLKLKNTQQDALVR